VANDEEVTISWEIRRQYDDSYVGSFSLNVSRDGVLWASNLSNFSITDKDRETSHTYTCHSVEDLTYGITAFTSNSVTVTWGIVAPAETAWFYAYLPALVLLSIVALGASNAPMPLGMFTVVIFAVILAFYLPDLAVIDAALQSQGILWHDYFAFMLVIGVMLYLFFYFWRTR